MTFTANLKTAGDLLAKLERDCKSLDEEVSSDNFFNFVVTAYSLCDWIKNDPTVNGSAKSALTTLRTAQEILICRDLANGNKHFELTNASLQQAVVTEVSANPAGYGVGRFGVAGYGVGEESITIILADSSRIELLQFKDTVLKLWREFFASHGM